MNFPCNTCETNQFCSEIERCLNEMITKRYGEAEMQDEENELTADFKKGLKKIGGEENVLGKDLNELELEIIKSALN